MKPERLALWGLLAASLTLNVLLLSRGERRSSESPRLFKSQSPNAGASSTGTSSLELRGAGISGERTRAGDQTRQSAEVSALRAEVQSQELALDSLLPPEKRFERGAPDRSTQRRLEGALGTVLSSDGGSLPYSVECRSGICRVDTLVTTIDVLAWNARMQALQDSSTLKPMVARQQFVEGTPTKDLVTGRSAIEMSDYLSVRSAADTRGMQALEELVATFKASSVLRNCTNGYAQKGVLKIDAILDVTGSVDLKLMDADLSATGAGACAREHFLQMAAQTTLPAPDTQQELTFYMWSPSSSP